VAEIADYETIRQLCGGLFADSVTEGASARVREVVLAVSELHAERAQGENITAAKVAKRVGISRPAASRRLGVAIAMGWVVNSEHRTKHPWILEPGEPMPETNGLPALQADANDESSCAPEPGTDPVRDASRGAEREVWVLDELDQWHLSYIREQERPVLPPPDALIAERGVGGVLSPETRLHVCTRSTQAAENDRSELEPWQQSILDEFDL
jgi:hypothetical protein